jgi:hypothetical protein
MQRDTGKVECLGKGAMKAPGSGRMLFLLLFLSLLCLALLPVPILPAAGNPVFESARACAVCHEIIYRDWSEGAHAKTWENVLYHSARAEYMRAAAAEDLLRCERCHAPVALLADDSHLLDPAAREGVTCDVCHTMRAPERGNGVLQPTGGNVKSGPTGRCPSGLHGCRKEERLTGAGLCAACHHYANEAGVPLYTEFTEWTQWMRSEKAGIGLSCRDCHFAPGGAEDLPGSGHRLLPLEGKGGLLENALTLGARILKEGEDLISVEVTNARAGHSVPGGPPLRSIVLEVRGYDSFGFEVFRDESVVFARRVDCPTSPATGLAIPWLAVRELQDDRIRAGETRSHTFRTGRSDIAKARVGLVYRRYRLHEDAEGTLLGQSPAVVMSSMEIEAAGL